MDLGKKNTLLLRDCSYVKVLRNIPKQELDKVLYPDRVRNNSCHEEYKQKRMKQLNEYQNKNCLAGEQHSKISK